MDSIAERRRTSVKTAKPKRAGRKEQVQSYLMIAPQIIGFLVFSFYPIIWVLRYAWFDYNSVDAIFVGFDNFVRVFQDLSYWKSVANTFIISIGKLLIELPLALFLAVLLSDKVRGRSMFRLCFYVPNIISVAIVGITFSYMFSSFDGIVNHLLQSMHLISAPINWFANKWTAIAVIMIASIWQGFGVNMIYFMAGLMNVPEELYECSRLDGANKVQQFIHVTLPQLAPVAQIICMLAIVSGIKMNDLILVLTNGQPGGETEVVMSYILKQFFAMNGGVSVEPQIGYACAVGVVTSIILALITVLYLRMSRKATSVNE